jgi:O-antigen/teichoic acid export membrane protein
MVAGPIARRPESVNQPIRATRRTFVNLAHIVGGEGLLRIANFVAAVAIARVDGPAVFGIYATALAYATIAAGIADNGLQVFAVHEIVAHPSNLSRIYSRLLGVKTSLFVTTFGALAALAAAYHCSGLVWTVGALITGRTILQSFSQTQISVMKATNLMTSVGPVQACHFCFLIAGLLCIRHWGGGIREILVLLLVGQGVEFAADTLIVFRQCRIRLMRVTASECWSLVKRSSPVGVVYSIANAALRLDVVVLTWLATSEVVGHYAAAQTVIVIVYVTSWLFGSVLLPELTRLNRDTRQLHAYVGRWTTIICAITIPASLVAAVSSRTVIPLAFGKHFAPSSAILSVLMLAAPLIMLNSLQLNLGIATGATRPCAIIYTAAALFGIVVATGFGYEWAGIGIAFAVVLRETFVFVAFRSQQFRALA